MSHSRKELSMRYMRDQGGTTCRNHLNCKHRLTVREILRCFTKQANLDKILKIIQSTVLKEMHLHVTVKEIQAGYLSSLCLNLNLIIFNIAHAGFALSDALYNKSFLILLL